MKPIILASKSPRRKELLDKLGLEFKVVESGFVEDVDIFISPEELVQNLALGKALAVTKKFKKAIVIGADTMVVLKNRVMGKPKDRKEAFKMLEELSGNTHLVMTGLAVIDISSNKKIVKTVTSQITFRKLSSSEIKSYIEKEKPMDKAGAYAIQEGAAVFVSGISGDYTNIIGLPVFELVKALKQFGIKI
jgi:septum formation protein